MCTLSARARENEWIQSLAFLLRTVSLSSRPIRPLVFIAGPVKALVAIPTEVLIASEGVLKADVKLLMKHIFSSNNRLQMLLLVIYTAMPLAAASAAYHKLMGLENQESESRTDLWSLSTEDCFPRPWQLRHCQWWLQLSCSHTGQSPSGWSPPYLADKTVRKNYFHQQHNNMASGSMVLICHVHMSNSQTNNSFQPGRLSGQGRWPWQNRSSGLGPCSGKHSACSCVVPGEKSCIEVFQGQTQGQRLHIIACQPLT